MKNDRRTVKEKEKLAKRTYLGHKVHTRIDYVH